VRNQSGNPIFLLAGISRWQPVGKTPRRPSAILDSRNPTLTQPSEGAGCGRCRSPGSAGRRTFAGAGGGSWCFHRIPETLTSSAPSNCSAKVASHEQRPGVSADWNRLREVAVSPSSVFATTFLAACVEVIEMVVIVVGVGRVRG
jgi:hypothetical protein